MTLRDKIQKVKQRLVDARYAIHLLDAYERSQHGPVAFSHRQARPDAVRFAAQLLERIDTNDK